MYYSSDLWNQTAPPSLRQFTSSERENAKPYFMLRMGNGPSLKVGMSYDELVQLSDLLVDVLASYEAQNDGERRQDHEYHGVPLA